MDISIQNNGNLSSCNLSCNTITLGYEFSYAETILSNEEFSTLVSDVIVHELIHGLLGNEFNNFPITALFDSISHLFGNEKIKEKVFKSIRVHKNTDLPTTWHNAITIEGFNVFLQDYGLDKQDLIQAYILAGGKQKWM